jgi:hypothetical protein
MYHHLFSILTNTNKFEELSIGCLDDVATYSNVLLQLLANLHSKSIRVLGFATLKCDPEDSSINSLDSHLFQNFINLQVRSGMSAPIRRYRNFIQNTFYVPILRRY